MQRGTHLSLRPGRVLEIGCGSGMIAARVAPTCLLYHGTDFSAAGSSAPGGLRALPQVTLERRAAHDFNGLEPESFDVVILNSVVQYFPDAEYLANVLQSAVSLLGDGGAIFVGDVRRRRLHGALATRIELYRAQSDLRIGQLRDRIARRMAFEEELLIDEEFFSQLQRVIPRIGSVEVRLKRGQEFNELTQFRYDVILRLKPPRPTRLTASTGSGKWSSTAGPPNVENSAFESSRFRETQILRFDWDRSNQGWSGLADSLEKGDTQHAIISNVPNQRVWRDVRIDKLVRDVPAQETMSALKQLIDSIPDAGIDFEDVLRQFEARGWQGAACWANSGDVDRVDLVFNRPPNDVINQQAENCAAPILRSPPRNKIAQ